MISTLSSLLMAMAIIVVGVAPHTVRLVEAAPSVFDNPNDHYAILGIEKTCNLKKIKSAYRKKAVLYHPDKVQGEAQKTYAQTKFILIGQAYSFLLKACEEHDTSFESAFDENASDTPSETPASAPCPFAAAFEILEQFLTAVKAEPGIGVIVALVVGGVCFFGTWAWFLWTVRRIWDLCFALKLLENISETGGRPSLYAKCLIVSWGAGHVALSESFRLGMGKWALNALTFSIFASLRLVWWVIRNVLALVCMAILAPFRAAVAGALQRAFKPFAVSCLREW
jgi:DnaJ domain